MGTLVEKLSYCCDYFLRLYSEVTLVDKDRRITGVYELAKTFHTSFENVVGIINIITSPEVNSTSLHNSVDNFIVKYRSHPSIKLILENVPKFEAS